MNTKLLNTLKTLCVVGALAATSFSVIAAPVEVQTKVIKEKAAVVCNIGYIEDTIVKIDEKNKQVIVGDAEDKGAQIIINVTKQTNILSVKDKKVYTFSDLEVGQKIGIESNGMMTNGQLTAFVLTVMEDENELEESLATCPVAGYLTEQIAKIDKEAKTITLGDKKDEESQIIVKVTENTKITDAKNKKVVKFSDLKVCQTISVESNGMMINGQVEAFEITIQ